MAITSVGDISDAYEAGRYWSGYWRRGGPTMVANTYMDMSYAAGIPVANYYAAAPYVSSALNGYEGIYAGPDVNSEGYSKYLHNAMLLPVTAIGSAMFIIQDIVMFYPFVDGDGGEQSMSNTISIPRYSGSGVQVFFVSQGAGTGISQVTVTYTNSAGTSGRTANCTAFCTATAGSVVSHAASGYVSDPGMPYIPLMPGDNGVRSIQTINVLSASGGIFAAVLAKPLGVIAMQQSETTPIEVDFMANFTKLPIIEDGAYVSVLGVASTAAAPATLHGKFDFIWG
jgi:hypothetical protein